MGFFKRQLSIDDAMRTMLAAVLSRRPADVLAELFVNEQLSSVDANAIGQELFGFDVAIVHMLFLQMHGELLEPTEFGRRFSIALRRALVGSGLPILAAAERALHGIDLAITYSENLDSIPEADVRQYGPFAYLCQDFTRRIEGNVDLRKERARDRHFKLFSVAQQNYQAVRLLFEKVQSDALVIA
ncbi:MAG: hypothetical protein H7Z40_06290 [Phycisphaerae bacterium]|nr:hypothetical protein [Gemmatimonadaceae bacterium]